jgi:two-component system sensor histidine kinase/response regulator
MLNNEIFIHLSFAGGLIFMVWVTVTIIVRMERSKQLQATIDKLKKALDEMDEQAKLIVRTDMELNKTQEELDRKMTGLYALQRLSSAISTTLEEEQIFKMIDPNYLEELNFEKSCALLWNEKLKVFQIQMSIGYSEEAAAKIGSSPGLGEIGEALLKSEHTLSSASLQHNEALKNKIHGIFKTAFFVLSPIMPKEGSRGFIFVGTDNPEALINEGDEELITILANQLGQALENARLFEKTWRAQHDLEKKVEERTRELTSALNEVKMISKRKTDFISAVSHELRTPLTSVKGYAAILLSGKLGNIPAEIRERLEKINRHSDELVHMVNDLLDIARIEANRMVMKKEILDLKASLEVTMDLLSGQFKEKQINFKADIPLETNKIFADRSQISRVFINLFGNALKFTPAQGTISVRAHKTDGAVQIDVTDTGCGIPEEAREAIFEEFYRVDNSINQEVKGTGLGLSLVKHIVEAHNGKIWVKSKIGSGSTFSFTIPQTG